MIKTEGNVNGTNWAVLRTLVLLFLLVGCTPEPTAATTPWGILYINGADQNLRTVVHEEAHWRRYQEGELDFWRYLTDSDYRCMEEMIANLYAEIYPINDHPFCENLSQVR